MSKTVSRVLVFSLSVALVTCQLPRFSSAAGSLERGAETAREAASQDAGANDAEEAILAQRVPAPLALGALEYMRASSDTTGLEFPGEDNDHVKRDIAVFIVVSAFVAIFIIKLFIEGDEEEEEDTGPVRRPPITP